jgi:hypothetical protein
MGLTARDALSLGLLKNYPVGLLVSIRDLPAQFMILYGSLVSIPKAFFSFGYWKKKNSKVVEYYGPKQIIILNIKLEEPKYTFHIFIGFNIVMRICAVLIRAPIYRHEISKKTMHFATNCLTKLITHVYFSIVSLSKSDGYQDIISIRKSRLVYVQCCNIKDE